MNEKRAKQLRRKTRDMPVAFKMEWQRDGSLRYPPGSKQRMYRDLKRLEQR